MPDTQLIALFTNMSTHAAKIVNSNVELGLTLAQSAKMVLGGVCALILAATWKG